MSVYALSADFGALSDENDRRFKRFLSVLGLPALFLGIVIPLLHITVEVIKEREEQRMVKVLQPPKPKPKQVEEPKPKAPITPKPQLTPEEKLARAKAKVSKMMRNFDELAALRDPNMPVAPQTLTTEIITSSSSTRSLQMDPDKTSGGIGDTHAVQRTTSTGIGSRSTTAVQSGIGSGGGTGGSGTGTRWVPGRTDDEIQRVFERSRGAYYAMYMRERRTHPDIQGKVVVHLTIAPNGHVTACKLVSSDLSDPEFEQSVVTRVLMMDFGAKDVPDFTTDYSFVFFPA
jgi:protein TonB